MLTQQAEARVMTMTPVATVNRKSCYTYPYSPADVITDCSHEYFMTKSCILGTSRHSLE